MRPSNKLLGQAVLALGLMPNATSMAQDTLSIMLGHNLVDANKAPSLPWQASPTFPSAICSLGDIDANGHLDFLVGNPEGDDGRGFVHVVLMEANGVELRTIDIGQGKSGFTCSLDSTARFGEAVAGIGDVNQDGIQDVAVLAPGCDVGSNHIGALFVLLLKADGSVLSCIKHSSASTSSLFQTIGAATDMDLNGVPDVLIGCPEQEENKKGRVLVMLLDSIGNKIGTRSYDQSSNWIGYNPCTNSAHFGRAVCSPGDVDGNGFPDLAVSSNASASSGGAVNIILLGPSGSILLNSSISGLEPEDPAPSDALQRLGYSLTAIGDANADGVPDVAASIPLVGFDSSSNYRKGEVQVLHLLPNGDLQYNEAITDEGWASNQSLGLAEGQPFAVGMTLFGDYNRDGSLDMAVTMPCPNGTSGCIPSIGILMLEPKPMVIAVQTQNETSTQHGSAQIKITGGVAPHTLHWANDLPTEAAFDSLMDGLRSMDWSGIGIDSNAFTGFTYAGLVALADYDPMQLKAGTYHLTAFDRRKKKAALKFSIGFDLRSDLNEGFDVTESDLLKTGGDGWTNNEYTSMNILGYRENGWMRFDAPQPGSIMAVGLRAVGVEQLNGYEQMEQALYFDGEKIQLWYGGALHETGISYSSRDYLRLHRLNSRMRFLINDSLIDEVKINPELQLFIDVAVYREGGGLKGLITTFQASGYSKSLKVKLVVDQMKCDGAPEGHLLAQVPAYAIGATYLWSTPGNPPQAGTASLFAAVPGLYSVTVTWVTTVNGNLVSFSGSAQAMVGFEALWTEHAGTQLGDEPNTLAKTASNVGQANASTSNEFKHAGAASQDWILRKVSGQDPVCLTFFGNNIGLDLVRFQRLSDGSTPVNVLLFDFGPFAVTAVLGGGLTSLAYPGDRIVMHVGDGEITVDNIDDALDPPIGFPAPAFVAGAEFRINGLVPCPGSEIVETLTSFGCSRPQRALLQDDLSAGYHRTYGKTLRIGYWEDYNDAALQYAVRAMNGSVVCSSSTQSVTVAYGYNELDIPVTVSGTPIPEGFYWLEVINTKGIKKYLRFFQDDLQQ